MTETTKGTKVKLKREKGNLANEGVGGGFPVFSYWIGASFGRVAGRMPAYPLAAAVRKLSQISQMTQKKKMLPFQGDGAEGEGSLLHLGQGNNPLKKRGGWTHVLPPCSI